tara:strand:+ start:2377 stop:2622 length:246 start_codon:yes stop_codon:yes gene_type:complete
MSFPSRLPPAVDTSLVDIASAMREPDPLYLPAYTTSELEALNRYCLKFRYLVHGGRTPTAEQEEKFMRYQAICHREGAAHV